jgi:hypothetical protein
MRFIRGFSSSVMINTVLPSCSNCVHFVKYTNIYAYDPIPIDKHLEQGKCNKFGELNLITGSVKYEFARQARENSDQCGRLGTHFYGKTEHN